MNSRRPRSLADYARAARRRKLVIVIPALVLASAAALALKDRPSLYESIARMRVASIGSDAAVDLSTRLNEFRRQLGSSECLEELRAVTESGPESSKAMQMSGRITVEADTNGAESGAFTVSFRATEPEAARKATDLLSLRLVSLGSTNRSSAIAEAELLRNQAANLSRQLRELEVRDPRLIAVRPDPLVAKPSQTTGAIQHSVETIRARQMTIESLKDQQYKIQQQLTDVERRIAVQRQVIEQQKRGSSLRDNPTYAVLITKRTELQGQRDTLINRQELTDRHPRVLAINDQIAAINRQIEELRQQDIVGAGQSPESRELSALESEQNRLKVDLEVTGRELVRRSTPQPIQTAPPGASRIRRDAPALKIADRYLELKLAREETANDLQLSETKLKQADAASPPPQVLVQATLPERPIFPNRALLISIAVAAGLVFGAAVAFLLESRRFNSLIDVRDVEYYTRLPLLVAIPRTATTVERRRARWLAVGRVALATATSTLAIFALARIFVAADIFALIVRK